MMRILLCHSPHFFSMVVVVVVGEEENDDEDDDDDHLKLVDFSNAAEMTMNFSLPILLPWRGVQEEHVFDLQSCGRVALLLHCQRLSRLAEVCPSRRQGSGLDFRPSCEEAFFRCLHK